MVALGRLWRVAPCELDGARNADSFDIYVEHNWRRQLEPGDVVICANLNVHKSQWAGQKKLASRVGCDPSSLNSGVSDLMRIDYLKGQRHETDGRKKGFRVVYKAK